MADFNMNLNQPTTFMKVEAVALIPAFSAPFVINPSNPTPPLQNFDMDLITNTYRGWLYGRRPATGSMYPRGVYNY